MLQFTVEDITARHRLRPSLFFSECLNELLQACSPEPPAVKHAALRGKWTYPEGLNDILAYEQYLHDIFKRVLHEYPQRSKFFLNSSVVSSPVISVVSSIGRSLTASLPYPIISFDSLKTVLPRPVFVPHPSKQDVLELDPAQPHFILQFYLAHRVEYTAIQLIPDIALFYQLLLNTFAHRITVEQAQQYSVPELIDWLEHQLFDSSKVASRVKCLREAYTKFCGHWNSVRSILAGMEVCPDAHNNRRFESDIIVVDDKSPLLSALVNTDVDGIPQRGAIPRLLEDLLGKQSRLLELRESDEYKELNGHGLLWDAVASADVSWIVAHCEHARSFFIGHQFTPNHFDEFAITAARFGTQGKALDSNRWYIPRSALHADVPLLERAVRFRSFIVHVTA